MASKSVFLYMDEEAIHPTLKCSVCFKPFVDPVGTDDGKRGCRDCFDTNSLHSEPCTPVKERIVLDILDGLLVRCERCEKTNIRRIDLAKHKDTECMLAMVSCKGADIKCPWQGIREQLSEHLDTCVYEPLRPALGKMMEDNKLFREQINGMTKTVQRLMQRTEM